MNFIETNLITFLLLMIIFGLIAIISQIYNMKNISNLNYFVVAFTFISGFVSSISSILFIISVIAHFIKNK